MSLGDFIDMFKSITINYTDLQYATRIIPADLTMPGVPDDDNEEGWAVLHIRVKMNSRHAFFRICQLDRKFLENDAEILEHEYAQMTMIVVKRARIPPKTEYGVATLEYAYLNGTVGKLAQLGVRVDHFRNGDYFILYKAEFEDQHRCQKLNILFQGNEDVLNTAVIKRIKPSSYKPSFFKEMMGRHYDRLR